MKPNANRDMVWLRFDEKNYPLQDGFFLKSFWKLKCSAAADDSSESTTIHQFLTGLTVNLSSMELIKFDVGFDEQSHYHHWPDYLVKRSFASNQIIQQVQEIKSVLNQYLQEFIQAAPPPRAKAFILHDEQVAQIQRNIQQGCKDILRYCLQREELISKYKSNLTQPIKAN